MPSFFKKRIMKQFRLVLCCLLIMGIVLSLLCYTVIERLMTKNSTAYAQSTAQKFNVEVKYLFDRADALFSSLLFNENIEQIMHTPFSAKTPSYLNALHTQFSSYRLNERRTRRKSPLYSGDVLSKLILMRHTARVQRGNA